MCPGAGGCAFSRSIDNVLVQINETEFRVVGFQNEIAKLTIDGMNTDAHNVKLQDTLKLLDEDLNEKAALIDRYEAEIRKRNDEIQKKTRAVDAMNRKLERLTCDQKAGEETGPLEATISSLNREIQRKEVEGKQLQRHWIDVQTALVARQDDNEQMSQAHDRLTSNCTILTQKRKKLEAALQQDEKEVSTCHRLLPSSMLTTVG
jgi:coiled-coil domain-containing protein 40